MIYFIIAIVLFIIVKFLYDKYLLEKQIKKDGGISVKYRRLVDFLSNSLKGHKHIEGYNNHVNISITTLSTRSTYTVTVGFDSIIVTMDLDYGASGKYSNKWVFNTNNYTQADMIGAISTYLYGINRRVNKTIKSQGKILEDKADVSKESLAIKDSIVEKNDETSMDEPMKNNLKNALKDKYSTQFANILSESEIETLADKIASISQSFSDTSFSIKLVNATLQNAYNASVIRKSLISITNNYGRNTIDNLAIVGNILGEQIIDIPYLEFNKRSIPMESIHALGFELLDLGKQMRIENELLDILKRN